jgi:hypothetical protein
MRHGVRDFQHQIVDSVDVAPRFERRIACRFYDVEVDAVREKILTANQFDDPRRTAAGVKKCVAKATALRRADHAIVEVEIKTAHVAFFEISDSQKVR